LRVLRTRTRSLDARRACLARARARAGDLLLEQAPYACVTTEESPACDACGRVADAGASALKRCTRCRAVRYCSADCQARGGARQTGCMRARTRTRMRMRKTR
jgi:hypothetical protein